jgi:hypothetical protein
MSFVARPSVFVHVLNISEDESKANRPPGVPQIRPFASLHKSAMWNIDVKDVHVHSVAHVVVTRKTR